MKYSPLPSGEGGGGGGTGCVRKRGIKEPTRRGPPWPRPSFFYTTATTTTTLLDGRRVPACYLTQLLGTSYFLKIVYTNWNNSKLAKCSWKISNSYRMLISIEWTRCLNRKWQERLNRREWNKLIKIAGKIEIKWNQIFHLILNSIQLLLINMNTWFCFYSWINLSYNRSILKERNKYRNQIRVQM